MLATGVILTRPIPSVSDIRDPFFIILAIRELRRPEAVGFVKPPGRGVCLKTPKLERRRGPILCCLQQQSACAASYEGGMSVKEANLLIVASEKRNDLILVLSYGNFALARNYIRNEPPVFFDRMKFRQKSEQPQ